MTAQTEPARTVRRRRLATVVAAVLIVTMAGLAAVYGIGGTGRNDGACHAAVETAKRMAPLAHGEVAAVTVATEGRPMPALVFHDDSRASRTLADWRGKTVLLNLWATWCVPCRKEMPALDALQAKLGGRGFDVVAVNIDTRNLDKPKAWLKEVGITGLSYYADPSAKVFQDLKAVGRAFGMPTTLLVDPAGCELGYIAGPAEWGSDDAVKLVEAALAK
jgi:thiol-disulfide isomerase/thioredoxin